MTFREWRENAADHVDRDGWVTGGRKAAGEFYLGMFRQVGKRWNYGRRIYEYDWDLLIVLDACRADLMAEVADEYAYTSHESAYSCASSSGEWHLKNFSDEYANERAETALVSANPYTDMHVEADNFRRLDEVWRTGFDSDAGTIPPERVVDSTIAAHRETDAKRIVAHFMQPHYPFRSEYEGGSGESGGIALEYDHTPWDTVWDRLRKGDISQEEAWAGYVDNLRYVLDHLGTLLQNVDAERVVITADHGNLLGEFGLYAHPQYVPIPALKRVPWIETSAVDTGEYEPDEREKTDVSVDEQLEALGYK